MVSTLSYLEAVAFRENVVLIFASLRIAQIAVELESEGQYNVIEFKQRIQLILDELD